MPDRERHRVSRLLVPGRAEGPILRLDEPLSFWGGLDAETGLIVDHHHPQAGTCVTGAILAMTSGRGSSSASSVLTESIRLGTSPAAIVLLEIDAIIVIGAVVADELYGSTVPVIAVDGPTYGRMDLFTRAEISPDGEFVLSSRVGPNPTEGRG